MAAISPTSSFVLQNSRRDGSLRYPRPSRFGLCKQISVKSRVSLAFQRGVRDLRLEYGKLHSGVTIFACKTATNFIQETSAAPSQPLPPPSTPLPSPLSAPGLGRTKRLKQCSRTKRRKRRRHLSSFARVGEQETRGEARGQFPVECGRSWARRISSFVDLPRSAQTFSTNLS